MYNLLQFGALRARFRESIGSVRGSERVSRVKLVQPGVAERVSRVNWFSSGRQSAFRESLVQCRASERVSRVNWFSSGIQSAFRESLV